MLDLPGVDDDLPRMHAHVQGLGGAFWVVTAEGTDEVVACGGWVPVEVPLPDGWRPAGVAPGQPSTCAELCRLYVRADHRRRGLGAWFVRRIEAAAAQAGHAVGELWSDTRFHDAHRLYAGLGWERTGETRELHDPSDTTEYRFLRRL